MNGKQNLGSVISMVELIIDDKIETLKVKVTDYIIMYLLIIYIAIFCHGTSLKKPSCHVGKPVSESTDMLCSRPSCIACLLTETSDAGSSPHVARWFFQ